jgi:hypothetical protein
MMQTILQEGEEMTELQSPVLRAERRSWTYWFDDGLPNLVAGVACMLIGFALLGAQARPRNPLVIALAALAFVLYGVVFFRMKQVIEWLKARITYPRTGYTATPYFADHQDALPVDLTMLTMNGADAKRALEIGRLHDDRAHRALLVAVLTALGLGVAWYVENRWLCLAAGVVAALAIWLVAQKNARVLWIEVVAFPFVGYWLLVLHMGRVDRIALFVVGGGLSLVCLGGVRLSQYLRRNPAPRA